MSRYYSFNDYMNDVIREANSECQQLHHCQLHEYAEVSARTFEGMIRLIAKNWRFFAAVTGFIKGHTGTIITAGLIAIFLGTPIGLLIAAVLGISAAAVIREMFTDKMLTPAVQETGQRFKGRWEELEGERQAIDNLVREAADYLLRQVGVK